MSDEDAVVVLSDDEESLFENDDGVANAPPMTVNDDDFADADADADENANNAAALGETEAPIIKLDDSDNKSTTPNDAAAANVIVVNSTLDESMLATAMPEAAPRTRAKKTEPAAKKSRTTAARSKAGAKHDSGKAESDDSGAENGASAHHDDDDEQSDDGWQRKKPKAKRAAKKQVRCALSSIFHPHLEFDFIKNVTPFGSRDRTDRFQCRRSSRRRTTRRLRPMAPATRRPPRSR